MVFCLKKMFKEKKFVLLSIFLIYFSVTIHSQNALNLLVGFGEGNIIDKPSKSYFSIELRKPFCFKNFSLSANFIIEGNRDDNYAGLGISFQKKLSQKFIVSLTTGFGRFSDEYFKLGSKIEFRSGIDLFYILTEKLYFVFSFYHYSNGGISNYNPGTESIVARIAIPLSGKFQNR